MRTRKRIRSRQNIGFSLLTVLSLGLVSTMMLFAVLSSILPLYQKASQNVPYVQLRNAAESACNMVVADLNDSILNSGISLYEDSSPGSPYTSKQYQLNSNSPLIKIVVKNESPSASVYSLYDNTLQGPIDAAVANPSVLTSSLGSYRIIEALASYQPNVSPQVLVRVIAKLTPYIGPVNDPNLLQPNQPASFLQSSTAGSNRPVFNYAALGIDSITLKSSAKISGADSRGGSPKLAGNISTNGTAALTGSNIEIDGSLTVTSPTSNPYNGLKVASGSPTSPPLIHNQLVVNGLADPSPIFKGTNGSLFSGPQAGDTVRGESRGRFDFSFRPIITNSSQAPNAVPPTPVAPDNARSIASPQNGQQIVFTNDASYPPSAEALTAYANGQSLALPPGDYTFPTLNIGADGSGSTIKISSDVTQPVRLFVDKNSNSEVSLGGKGIQNSSKPSNLQVYYAGSNPVYLASNLTGLIYTPNAAVTVGAGKSLNVYGSIVGRTVTVENARLTFDKSLSDSAYLNGQGSKSSNLTYDPLRYSKPQGLSKSGTLIFKVVSYQEIKNPLQ